MERAKGNWPDAKEIRYGGTYEKVNASFDPVKDEYRQFSLKNNPNAKVGININDSTQAFTEQILNGEKTVQTRKALKGFDKNGMPKGPLDSYIGQRIGLVHTGKGKGISIIIEKSINGKQQIGRVDFNYSGNYKGKIIDANKLTSSYGKNRLQQMINNAIADEVGNRPDGGVFYWNEKKPQMFVPQGTNFQT